MEHRVMTDIHLDRVCFDDSGRLHLCGVIPGQLDDYEKTVRWLLERSLAMVPPVRGVHGWPVVLTTIGEARLRRAVGGVSV